MGGAPEIQTNNVVGKPRGRVRFGIFEADLQAGELRKHGLKIKLYRQPFEVLAMLLQRPGELVTREEFNKNSGNQTHSSISTTDSTKPSIVYGKPWATMQTTQNSLRPCHAVAIDSFIR